jgi:hypothetical protein
MNIPSLFQLAELSRKDRVTHGQDIPKIAKLDFFCSRQGADNGQPNGMLEKTVKLFSRVRHGVALDCE